MTRTSAPARPAAPPTTAGQPVYCMFCGTRLAGEGEPYYDHLRANKTCESNWRAWRENLLTDHPGGD